MFQAFFLLFGKLLNDGGTDLVVKEFVQRFLVGVFRFGKLFRECSPVVEGDTDL